jgi:superfamily II DNA helicase RecQ
MTTKHFQSRLVLQILNDHPAAMSAVLLDHFLRGEVLGRMAEKGLLDSPHFGALSTLPSIAVAALIEGCMEVGWLTRAEGFYPALSLTAKGESALDAFGPTRSEVSPDTNYKAYYRWRQTIARALRKPPYRIVPNATLNALALRRPTTLEELLRVPGLGKRRALRYHLDLVEVGRALAGAEVGSGAAEPVNV